MAHASVENRTPFAFEPLSLADEEGHALYVPVVKATYAIGVDGSLTLAEKQPPLDVAGAYWGEPGESSYKYEPQFAFTKLSTDVILIGHAYSRGSNSVHVRLRMGSLDKTVSVVGDRYWLKTLSMVSMTSPEPFETMPLTYERAFGGWDRSHSDPDKHTFDARNPVGTGFRSKTGNVQDGTRLPNLEDPRNPIRIDTDTPPPTGFGFISPDWQPRAALAGTYDEKWTNERMPLLPSDFDRRFFSAASPGMIAPGYLRGDEVVSVENASPRGMLSFRLPGAPAPECRVQLTGSRDARIATSLDTVIVNTDEDLLVLIWRGHLSVRNGPHDIMSIQITAEGVSAPAAVR